MRNFQNTFETRKRPFVSGISICMTVPLTIEVTLVNMYFLIFQSQDMVNLCLNCNEFQPIYVSKR